MENILVIKLSERPNSLEALKERAEKAWKLNPKRLDDVNHVIVLYQLEVIADYQLGDEVKYYLNGQEKGRVWLSLEDYKGDNSLKGKHINYLTANPATIKKYSDLKPLIED